MADDYSIAAAPKGDQELNILQATFLAMNRAFDRLQGNRTSPSWTGPEPGVDAVVETVEGRCTPCPSPRVHSGQGLGTGMLEIAKLFPQYQFEKHKGYGTKLHYEMLQQYGVSEVHRRSFLKNLEEHFH